MKPMRAQDRRASSGGRPIVYFSGRGVMATYRASGSVSNRLVKRALGGWGPGSGRRAEQAAGQLRQTVDRGRNTAVLEALVRVAQSNGPGAPSARQALDAACEDVVFLVHLAASWAYRWYSGRNSPLVVSLLLQPAHPAAHVPHIRLMRFLDADPNEFEGRDREHLRWGREHVPGTLVRAFQHDMGAHSGLDGVFRATDYPDLLEALARSWVDSQTHGVAVALADIVRTNQNIPRVAGGKTSAAILGNRFDLLDKSSTQTVDALLDGLGSKLPEVAEGCRRALRELAPGAARDRLCNIALNRADARAVVDEKGWYPSAERDRVIFFFLTGQMDRYTEMDPHGQLLREAYRRADYETQSKIREIVRRLANETRTPAGRVAGGRPDPGGEPGGAGFDAAGFAADMGFDTNPTPTTVSTGYSGYDSGGSDGGGSSCGGGCGGCGGD